MVCRDLYGINRCGHLVGNACERDPAFGPQLGWAALAGADADWIPGLCCLSGFVPIDAPPDIRSRIPRRFEGTGLFSPRPCSSPTRCSCSLLRWETVLFPSLASTRGSSLRIRSTLRLAAIVACIMLLAVAAAAWLGPIAFPLIYGKAYAASMPILFAMLPGVATLGVCSVMQNALSANGYPWAAVASPVAGVLAVSLGLYFTDTVIGCGWAYSIGAAVMLSFSSVAWWFHRHDWSEIGESAASADHLPT